MESSQQDHFYGSAKDEGGVDNHALPNRENEAPRSTTNGHVGITHTLSTSDGKPFVSNGQPGNTNLHLVNLRWRKTVAIVLFFVLLTVLILGAVYIGDRFNNAHSPVKVGGNGTPATNVKKP